LTNVNENINLIQRKNGLTFGTDAFLLASFLREQRSGIAVELGGGTGIISLLSATRGKFKKIYCAEIQPEFAEVISRNVKLNSLEEKIVPICADVRELKSAHIGCEVDAVFSNPPYMKANGGKSNESDKKNIARHEVFGNIDDFCKSAKRMLKFGGTFAAVYRPDRLMDLLYSMRKNSLEPKKMTFVHADTGSEPSMVLVEGRAGGKCSLLVTKPLIIYKDPSHKEYTDDMNFIMENGSFPIDYKR
jgi:tRNA1(Val) A37 N6-methylase TrmN6